MQIDFQSINCYGENLCGDSFLREESDGHLILVHSDGMGHGPKANVLSELTCEIIMSEWEGRDSVEVVLESLALRLPLCSVRGIGYSTFTLLDFDIERSVATIVEYENPPTLLFRGAEPLLASWDAVDVNYKEQQREVLVTDILLQKGDSIVICSDGVTQSGLGLEGMPSGWGSLALAHEVEKILGLRGDQITASELASRIISRAVENEKYYPRDDISTLVFRVD